MFYFCSKSLESFPGKGFLGMRRERSIDKCWVTVHRTETNLWPLPLHVLHWTSCPSLFTLVRGAWETCDVWGNDVARSEAVGLGPSVPQWPAEKLLTGAVTNPNPVPSFIDIIHYRLSVPQVTFHTSPVHGWRKPSSRTGSTATPHLLGQSPVSCSRAGRSHPRQVHKSIKYNGTTAPNIFNMKDVTCVALKGNICCAHNQESTKSTSTWHRAVTRSWWSGMSLTSVDP